MKPTYIIKETQNINSEREGIEYQANSLTSAKRYATSHQFYHGTVLKIEAENGTLLSYKEIGGEWLDTL